MGRSMSGSLPGNPVSGADARFIQVRFLIHMRHRRGEEKVWLVSDVSICAACKEGPKQRVVTLSTLQLKSGLRIVNSPGPGWLIPHVLCRLEEQWVGQ